ncbi:MAG TPA: CehA/McbA family metallohydrolase [Kofleriaceae bacterium]|nr:CehA/McbA family metallohydrolase [Kofleriaceae bacterium]
MGILIATSAGLVLGTACGDDGGNNSCAPGLPPDGDMAGHPEPFGASVDEARAGRITAVSQLPATTLGLEAWSVGDFVLANDKVALVIEDVGNSDLYDPWGGRPVGAALVQNGAMVAPADFGEIFLLISRSSIVTEHVTIVNDGANGEPAVIRASGRLAPLPFLDPLTSGLLPDDMRDLDAAIDYTLRPGAETVDITYHINNPRDVDAVSGTVLHGFMYTKRMRTFVPNIGFTDSISGSPWAALIDDDGASIAYEAEGEPLGGSIAQAGFVGALNNSYDIPRCALTTRLHAHITIGGPGVDGIVAARARVAGTSMRAITGTVTGLPAGTSGRVHAVDANGNYLTRAPVDATGAFTLHVPTDAAVTLTLIGPGSVLATTDVAAGATTATLPVPLLATLVIARVADDNNATIPARIQVMPDATGPQLVDIPDVFGEPEPPGGRHEVRYHDGTPMRIPLRPGGYHVVVSRGPEYELFEQDIDADAGNDFPLAPVLEHVVDTTGQLCGDFHIHTIRSNDAEDIAAYKVQSGMADGLDLMIRSDHEWVDDFQPLIEDRGWEQWVKGIASIEMTSFEIWGHFGVFPLEPDPTQVNQGAPKWQTFPTAGSPDGDVVTLQPVEVFDAVRARPERPTIIINHPNGDKNYFGYVGLDPATGLVEHPEHWDDEFKLVEVFNNDTWSDKRNAEVADWFAILNTGREVFAVGSSDSHSVRGSPVGYPRTCVRLGTDDPRQVNGDTLRDELAAGHASVAGGIYVTTAVGTKQSGETVTGAGAQATVAIQVQAASWVDVDTVEVVVDGETVMTIPVTAGDADPQNPVIRFQRAIPVDVATAGSWVVVAAYGGDDLAPVFPGHGAFGVTNPIFLRR